MKRSLFRASLVSALFLAVLIPTSINSNNPHIYLLHHLEDMIDTLENLMSTMETEMVTSFAGTWTTSDADLFSIMESKVDTIDAEIGVVNGKIDSLTTTLTLLDAKLDTIITLVTP